MHLWIKIKIYRSCNWVFWDKQNVSIYYIAYINIFDQYNRFWNFKTCYFMNLLPFLYNDNFNISNFILVSKVIKLIPLNILLNLEKCLF